VGFEGGHYYVYYVLGELDIQASQEVKNIPAGYYFGDPL